MSVWETVIRAYIILINGYLSTRNIEDKPTSLQRFIQFTPDCDISLHRTKQMTFHKLHTFVIERLVKVEPLAERSDMSRLTMIYLYRGANRWPPTNFIHLQQNDEIMKLLTKRPDMSRPTMIFLYREAKKKKDHTQTLYICNRKIG